MSEQAQPSVPDEAGLPPVEPAATAGDEQAAPSPLRRAFLKGSAWSFGGYAVEQVFRLASNLILTRLLFPEAFGLMALVNIFLQGLMMFSDLGLGPSIIQHPRGEETNFLNTAWTVQVIRGFVLALCGCIVAWPVAAFYEQPQLLLLVPAAGLSCILSGFNSTALYTENRRLALGRLTILGIVSQVIGLVVMAVWAYTVPTVWALLGGSVVTAFFKMLFSHLFLPGIRNRFHWDTEVWKELFSFGRWIFLSTAFSFLASQGDRLILGKCLDIGRLGVYNIALFLATAVVSALTSVSMNALFPLYSRLTEEDPCEYEQRIWKYRLVFLAVGYPVLAGLIVFGDTIVQVLYDTRYAEAGLMLQILSIGSVANVMLLTLSNVPLAVGNSLRFMAFQLCRWLCLIVGMVVGRYFFGPLGLIAGVAASAWLTYPFLIALVKRYRVWTPWLDLGAVGGCGALVGLGFLVKPWVDRMVFALQSWALELLKGMGILGT